MAQARVQERLRSKKRSSPGGYLKFHHCIPVKIRQLLHEDMFPN